MNGFGFVDTLKKIGMERRLMTSGTEKGFLDPFSPVKPGDEAYMKKMLDIIHQQFIQVVKDSRGAQLKNDPLLFTGLVWTGPQAKELGLIDGIATPEQVARDIIKQPTMADYSSNVNFFQKFANNFGSSAGSSAASQLGFVTSFLH
jgi:protease-4